MNFKRGGDGGVWRREFLMQVLGLAKGLRAEVRATHVGKLPMNPRTFNIGNYPQLTMAWCSLKHTTHSPDVKFTQYR